MTEREIYTSMVNGSADPAVLAEFGAKKLAQLDKRNLSAQKRAQAKRAEGAEVTESVFSVVSAEPATRNEIADRMGNTLSVAKVGARLNTLVTEGRIQKINGKIAGEDGKAKRAVMYFIAE